MALRKIALGLAVTLVSGSPAACGSSSKSASTSSGAGSAQANGASGSGAGSLSAESQAAATGDIPDSQVFLTYHNPSEAYTISYPEGWAQRGSGRDVTFQAKNNIIRVVVSRGPAPTPAAVIAQLARERQRQPSLTSGASSTTTVHGAPVIKVSYSTESQPNPVTGKRIKLLVDRYVFAHAGKVLMVDLGTPKGVDNVDAYRMISRSLRWL